MKVKSYITIAFREFVHSIKTFVLYFIILVCLESISITMLKAESNTPDKIADIADELGYNCMYINCNEISDIDDIFDNEDIIIKYAKSNIMPSFRSGIFDYGTKTHEPILSNYSEGVICQESKFENKSNVYLLENMISGKTDFNSDKDYIWISSEISNEYKVSVGDVLEYKGSENYIKELEIAGIYTASSDICSLFITESTYDKIFENVSVLDFQKLEVWIKSNDFKKIGKHIDILNNKKVSFRYDDDLYSAVNMMYASFYSAVFILTCALTGIVIYLSDLYYNKRSGFFFVNYIIGMSQKDIINIIIIIIGMLIVSTLLVSVCVCMMIMNYFNNYLFELFNIDFELSGFPVEQFVIYCGILFFCLLIVLFRIKNVIKKTFLSGSGRNI